MKKKRKENEKLTYIYIKLTRISTYAEDRKLYSYLLWRKMCQQKPIVRQEITTCVAQKKKKKRRMTLNYSQTYK